ncbi:MAG: hypothetical protein B7Z27_05245, partial [Sphingobacteriia bacterium 32-37-4]
MADKNNVYKDYEVIADWFDKHRSRDFFEKPYLDKVISYLKPDTTILDLGCGMGEPIAQYFIEQGFDLTGIDGSKNLIKLAQKRFPSATWIVDDMRKINLSLDYVSSFTEVAADKKTTTGTQKFDCVIVWHSLFHLPADDQRKMFKIFADHLNQQGMLLFTSGHEAGEVWSNNGGENLYHASLSAEEYEKLLDKELVSKVYKALSENAVYQVYITEESRDKGKEREIIKLIFSELMLPNENFISHIEEHFNNWDDDAEMMEQLVLTYIQKPKSVQFNEIMSPDKWEFAKTLLKTAIDKKEYCAELIKPKLKNWDAERIAQLDMVLMRMGLCELLYFDTIPT